MINLKQYIINRISQYDSNIDTSPGSNVRDILIDPLTDILSVYEQDHEDILRRSSLADIDRFTDEELDAAAMNFFIERDAGSTATGKIKLYFTEPQAFSMPKGTQFETEGGVVIETTADYTISRVGMQNNLDNFPFYNTSEINAIAVEPGEDGNLSTATKLKAVSTLAVSPSKVQVSTTFSGGGNREDNQTFYNRIIDTIFNKTLASPGAIESRVKTQQSSVTDVEVIGAGYPQMLRDLTDFYGNGEYKFEDYSYVYKNLDDNGFNKSHKAYYGVFTDPDGTDDIGLPAISDFTLEFTDDMYKGVYNKDDSAYADISQYTLLSDLGSFLRNDGTFRNNQLRYEDEITISGGIATLGATLTDEELSDIEVSASELSEIQSNITAGNSEAAQNILNGLLSDKRKNNLSPILHSPLDRHLGVEIDVTMSTTDDTELGEMAYITVLRNDAVFAANDGFGLAWRKQPAYLIRINEAATSGDITDEDRQKFLDEYGVSPDPYVNGELENNSQFWKYNVYIVDNNVLDEEVFIQNEQIASQGSGVNEFLASSKVWMTPNTEYSFKLRIYETLGVEGWVFAVGSEPATYSEANRTIYRGATYPNYLPLSGELKTYTTTGGKVIEYRRGNFGIGVGQTRNYEWTAKDLLVNTFIEVFPMHLFKFKVDEAQFNLTDSFNIEYYGSGFDSNQTPEADHSKAELAIWNDTLSEWENVGFNLAGPSATRAEQVIESRFEAMDDYVDTNNEMYVLAYPANSGSDFPNDKEHQLRSYYIRYDNDLEDKVHRGNAVDVYCYDPTNYKIATVTYTIDSQNQSTSNINTFPGFAIDIIEIRESISQNVIPRSDYRLYSLNTGYEYSVDSVYSISFTDPGIVGTSVEIDVLYWSEGATINSYLTSSSVAYPAVDMLAKSMPTARVVVNSLSYSGALTEESAKNALINYLNSGISSFDKSDIVDVLYDAGANFVDLAMDIDIHQKRYDFSTTVFQFNAQTYNVPFNVVGRIFTRIEDLEGVQRV